MGDSVRLRVEKISSDGSGIARAIDGLIVFLPGVLPEEEAIARITAKKKEYAIGVPERILVAHSERVSPLCPLYGKCGGCQFQHADYSLQLHLKTSIVRDAFERIFKHPYPPVTLCVGSSVGQNYRNKASFPVRDVGGEMFLGYFARRSHTIVPITACPVLASEIENAPGILSETLSHLGLTSYDEKSGKGMLRHVILRFGIFTGNVLLSLVVAAAPSQSEKKKLVKKLIPTLSEKFSGLRSVTLNLNASSGNVIVGEKTVILHGDGLVAENLPPFRFMYDSTAFFQVNTHQTLRLYAVVVEMAVSSGQDSILELYSGIGSLTAFLARSSFTVTAVEEWGPSIDRMNENIAANGLSGKVRIIRGSVEKHIHCLPGTFDAVVLDPPRTGCGEEVSKGILALAPQKIVYVSCNPATLARDAAWFFEGGYVPEKIVCFDMFPQTVHVETVALFTPK